MHRSSNHLRSHSSENVSRRTETPITIDDDDDDSDDDFRPDENAPVEATKEILTLDNIPVRFDEVDAEKLLPSPFFPHLAWVKDNYWNEDNEAALQHQHGSWASSLAAWAVNQ